MQVLVVNESTYGSTREIAESALKAPVGDFRDCEMIRAWAGSIASALEGAQPGDANMPGELDAAASAPPEPRAAAVPTDVAAAARGACNDRHASHHESSVSNVVRYAVGLAWLPAVGYLLLALVVLGAGDLEPQPGAIGGARGAG
jgi:hypothetical protein